jgi:DNA-binding winged helix-turn-helix (wHTH) protein
MLDQSSARLTRGTDEIDLPPRAYQVLTYLIENRGRVVPKQELVEAVWKDTFVTDDALVQAISMIRHALGDTAENSHYIRTRPRIGYQFIAEVEAAAGKGADPPVQATSIWVAPVSRRTARRLMMAIQLGYLGLYSVTLFNLDVAVPVLSRTLLRPLQAETLALPLLLTLALIGVAVRLYLLTTVALDHPATARQYVRLLPALFLLDLLWAFTPLLLVEETGLPVALVLIPVLVYAPFSQATLVRSAYSGLAPTRVA